GRAANESNDNSGGIPILHLGANRLPLAVTGAPGGAVSVSDQNPFRLEITGGGPAQQRARKQLLEDLSSAKGSKVEDDLTSFVQRRQVQTLTAVENLRELLEGPNAVPRQGSGLTQRLQIIAGLIAKGFGTRIFYVSLDGFDTHAGQAEAHAK